MSWMSPGIIGFAALATLYLGLSRYRPKTRLPVAAPRTALVQGGILLVLAIALPLLDGVAVGLLGWMVQLGVAGAILALLVVVRRDAIPLAIVAAIVSLPLLSLYELYGR
jgi:hypothetical protein